MKELTDKEKGKIMAEYMLIISKKCTAGPEIYSTAYIIKENKLNENHDTGETK